MFIPKFTLGFFFFACPERIYPKLVEGVEGFSSRLYLSAEVVMKADGDF